MTNFNPSESLRPRGHSRYFLYMGVVIVVAVVIGFSRTWFFQPWTGAPSLSTGLHLHGLAAAAWFIVYLIQTVLVDRNLVRIHRRIGIFGAVVAILFAISAIAVSIDITLSKGGTAEAIHRLGLIFVVALTFLLLVGAGVGFRRDPESHKRLMLLATIQAATPAIGRFPFPEPLLVPCALSVIMLLLVSVVVYDIKTLRRIHMATIFGVTVVILSLPGRQLLGATEMWSRFATFIID